MNQRWWLIGLVVALLIAVISPLASPHPDGLERVAEDEGFIEHAQSPLYELIPDYVLPGIDRESVATVLAGVIGTLIIFALVFGVGKIITRRSRSSV